MKNMKITQNLIFFYDTNEFLVEKSEHYINFIYNIM